MNRHYYGSEIVKRLAAQNIPVRAMLRNCNQASATIAPSVEVVEANFDRPETLATLFYAINAAASDYDPDYWL